MAKTKQSTSSQASPATPSNAYASFAAGTGPYPNQNVYYNPKSDPTGGYGALSNFDFSPYAGNKGAIKELGQAYGISLSPEQLDLYARNPQSLGSLRAGGTSSYQGGPQQGYGYSGPYGGMATSGGIPLGTLMMMRGQGQNQAAPPPAPTSSYNQNPTIQLTPQQSGTLSPQVTQAAPPLSVAPSILPQQPISPQPVSQPPTNAGNVLNPIPVQMQPVQQFQSGGLVTDPNLRLSGGSNQSNQQTAPPNYYGYQYPIYALNAQGSPTGQPNYASPTDLAGLLGAAALQSPYVQNVTPSGTPSSKSGVAPVGGAMIGTSVPQVTPTWESVGQNAGFSPRDIDTFKAQGLTPADVVQKFPTAAGPLAGPWTTNAGVFAKAAVPKPTAPLALNPITPASAVPYAPGQAFATPPAAPTSIPSALPPAMAQSGATTTRPPAAMLPAGFMGGAQGAGYVPQAWQRPPSGAPVPYTGTVHNDPYMSHAVSSLLGMPSNPWHPGVTPGATVGANQPATGAKQMATGGVVPGRGNEDTVPALLTPGEYVIPKEQVNQLMRTGSTALKMQSGGLVQDPDPDPPEARRQALTVPTPSSQSTSPSTSSTPSAPSQHPDAAQSILGGLQNLYQGGGGGLFGAGGGIPAGSTAGAGAYGTVGSLMAGQGSAGAAGSLGQLPAGGMSSGAQSALGGIGSGLTQAAQAIASSVKPWQPQQSAIPDPSQLPKYQTPTLQPVRVT